MIRRLAMLLGLAGLSLGTAVGLGVANSVPAGAQTSTTSPCAYGDWTDGFQNIFNKGRSNNFLGTESASYFPSHLEVSMNRDGQQQYPTVDYWSYYNSAHYTNYGTLADNLWNWYGSIYATGGGTPGPGGFGFGYWVWQSNGCS